MFESNNISQEDKFLRDLYNQTVEKLLSSFEYQRSLIKAFPNDAACLTLKDILVYLIGCSDKQGNRTFPKTIDDIRYALGIQNSISGNSVRKYMHNLVEKGFISTKRSKINLMITVNAEIIGKFILDNLDEANATYASYIEAKKASINTSKETVRKNRQNVNLPSFEAINELDSESVNYGDNIISVIMDTTDDEELSTYFALVLYYYHKITSTKLNLTAVKYNTIKQSFGEVRCQADMKTAVCNKLNNALMAQKRDVANGIKGRFFEQYFREANKDSLDR